VLRDRRSPPWLPWALCWLSLGFLAVGLVLRIGNAETFDDAPLYAVANVLGIALVPPVGALIAARLPANPYGWLLCAVGLLYAVVALLDGLRRTGVIAGWVVGILMVDAFAVVVCLLVFVLLLFPTGRLAGRGWRWVARAAVLLAGGTVLGALVAPLPDEWAADSPWAVEGRTGELLFDVLDGAFTGLLVLVVAAAASVVVRFRRAGEVERQQLKWFLLAAGVAAATIGIDVIGVPVDPAVWAIVDAVSFALLPLSIGIAVLRYRLFEVDRVVSRTVSYGLLTGGLIGLYLLVVALLRPLLEPLTGGSSLAVAGSTLLVAAAFNPARRRLQAVVDRRFDRARYDAARAVDLFSARLRDQVDLDQVVAGLRDTVTATVAPTCVAVWFRDVPSAREA
jgi:hypothetical protein